MRIYFAGSIRGGRDDWTIYKEIIASLSQYGTVLTEHIGDSELSVTGEDLADSEIHDRDLAWLRSCDFLVAEVTRPSLGVGYEIGKATEWGMKVLCLYRPSVTLSLSAMIAGCHATVHQYHDPAELSDLFTQYFSNPPI
jgi:2'-deoxynucleoside 5'-phosphate N-hydrolase